MGQKYHSKKRSLSATRLSRKKSWVKRQKQMKLSKSAQDIRNAPSESTDSESSVDRISTTSSEVDAKLKVSILNCLDRIVEEQSDNSEKEVEASDKEAEETVEHCEDEKNSVSVNNDDNAEETEGDGKEDEHDQSIDYSEDKKETDNCNSCSENESGMPEKLPLGSCFIDFSYFWRELKRIFTHHSRGIDCDFKYWKLVNYQRHGLLTKFFFKCEMCHYEANIWSEPKVDSKTPDFNARVVTAGVKAGLGYSQLKQLFQSVNVVFMSYPTYRKHWENLTAGQKNAEDVKNEVPSNEN